MVEEEGEEAAKGLEREGERSLVALEALRSEEAEAVIYMTTLHAFIYNKTTDSEPEDKDFGLID